MNDINDYKIPGVNQDKIQNLHNLVLEYKDSLFKDNSLQDFLLNSYNSSNGRPTSFFELPSDSIHRKKVIQQFNYLDRKLNEIDEPELAFSLSAEKFEDLDIIHDIIEIDQIKNNWREYTIETELIRDLQNNLYSSFEEFNLNLVLSKIYHARYRTANVVDNAKEINKRIQKIFEPAIYNKLYETYYETGLNIFKIAKKCNQDLSLSDFGKFFIEKTKNIDIYKQAINSD